MIAGKLDKVGGMVGDAIVRSSVPVAVGGVVVVKVGFFVGDSGTLSWGLRRTASGNWNHSS